MELETARRRLFVGLSRQISDDRVIESMARVRRELFVPSDSYHLAYEDMPLSIGFGQTISQPFIVAMMTQALELKGQEKVLEIGTGSGYQTAILAELASMVLSVERVSQLVESAREILSSLGYRNVEVHLAGRDIGWPSEAPYDAIMVTAGAPSIPGALLKQMTFGGRLVIPVGSRWEQNLLRVTKKEKKNRIENLGGCRFVPLIGEDAWKE